MGNFRYKLARFMAGRNGIDTFCTGLLKVIVFLLLADIFVPGNLLTELTFIIWIYFYYRIFSRNLPRRYAENQWYIWHIEKPLKGYLSRDRKNYRYFRCPCCRQTLRAPKGRGRIRVTCSRCHNIFEKKV